MLELNVKVNNDYIVDD